MASGRDAQYDEVVRFDAADIEPMVTWGITPGLSVAINEPLPPVMDFNPGDRPTIERAYEHMGLRAGEQISETKVDLSLSAVVPTLE